MEIQKTIKLLNNSYSCNYPTVGQIISIKTREFNLSKGQIKDLLLSYVPDDNVVAIDIKAIAHMEILFPTLIKDLKTQSLEDLRYDDFQAVVEVYVKDILPWLNDWKKKFNEPVSIDEKVKEPVKE